MNVQTVKYTIGLDFGSLSCWGVLADARNGDIVAEASMEYPHGVIEGQLPDGTPLPDGWYLQAPADFEQALVCVIRSLVREGGAAEQIVGIGIDSTASAVLPLDDGAGFRFTLQQSEHRTHMLEAH